MQGNIEYYSDEVEINAKFRTFTKSCSLVFSGHNTVTAQLKNKSKRGTSHCFNELLKVAFMYR